MDDKDIIIEELRERVRQLESLILPAVTLPPEWGLTPKESAIFSALLSAPTASKEKLLCAVYQGANNAPVPKILDVFICKLRRKLKAFGVQIETVWGLGFQLVDQPNWKARLCHD